ncbi:MAG: DUF2505 domain-containing protein [Bradymonadaceae bacterium]|nr:DUF2505 domain-containing protein [Lujinxingiaceae bacterium]
MSHEFSCEPPALWDIFFGHDEFERRLEQLTDVRREVQHHELKDGVEFSLVRCSSKRELPAPMAKALGMKSFVFDQENRLDRDKNLLHWKVILGRMSERVKAEGTTSVRATATGCVRTIEGNIEVKIPFIGGKMEEKVAQSVQDSYAKAAEIARELLLAASH